MVSFLGNVGELSNLTFCERCGNFTSTTSLRGDPTPRLSSSCPKLEWACGLKHFRPISLIGSLYKVISKVFAKRMKSVMGKLIGENQTTYLKGRNILDGVVILNEIIRDAKISKNRRLIFKVDFSKAFDSINWDYLLDMMKGMNFPDQWLSWMKTFVTTSANFLINGSASGEFSLERG